MPVVTGPPPYADAPLVIEHTAHLFRLTGWSLASVAAGLFVLLRDRRSMYGAATVVWAFLNYATVLLAVVAPPPHAPGFGESLVLNLGWNAVLIAVGFATMRHRAAGIADAGRAVLHQAVVLTLLNGWLHLRMP